MTSLGAGTAATAAIPTISAAVSSSNLSSKSSSSSSRKNSNDALHSHIDKQQQQHLTTKQIVQQKFKQNENVLSVMTRTQHFKMFMNSIVFILLLFFFHDRSSRHIRLSVKNTLVVFWVWSSLSPVALMRSSLWRRLVYRRGIVVTLPLIKCFH